MDCCFIGVQLVVDRARDGARVAGAIRQLLRSNRGALSREGNRALHYNASRRMLQALDASPTGYWDFIPDPARARGEYDDWCREIEVASSLGAQGDAGPFRQSAAGRLVIVTGAWLVLRGSASARKVGEACAVEASAFWRRSTFQRVLEAFAEVDFRDVQDDALYVVPGNDQGLPEAHVRGDDFAYLRALT